MSYTKYLRPESYAGKVRHLANQARHGTHSAISATRDVPRLRREYPELKNYLSLIVDERRRLLPFFSEYVTSVSDETMAISLELAVFLSAMCRIRPPRRILDLGSGFSSFTLRLKAEDMDPKPEVWSVDNSEEWLARTHGYLAAHGLSTDRLMTWSEFQVEATGPFDFILHDLGSMTVRAQTVAEVLGRMSPSGMAVLDDIDKAGYMAHVRRALTAIRARGFILKPFTEDWLGRYSMLVLPRSRQQRTGGRHMLGGRRTASRWRA